MNSILPVSLQALQNDSAAMDRIGANIANLPTPGYRREMAVQAPILGTDGLSAFAGTVASQLAQVPGQAPAPVLAAALPGTLHFDTRPGTLKTTDAPLDVALLSAGYFEVETDHGPAYSRNGQFHVDARGTLVTSQGHPVAGRGGQITLMPGPVTIDAAGQLTQNGHSVGRLKVVELDAPGAL